MKHICVHDLAQPLGGSPANSVLLRADPLTVWREYLSAGGSYSPWLVRKALLEIRFRENWFILLNNWA
jgi:hypothetical protein